MRPATPELVALALQARPDWDEAEFRAALARCHMAGWSWERTLVAAARCIADPDASPADLASAAENPLARRHVHDPSVSERGVALARELLGARNG